MTDKARRPIYIASRLANQTEPSWGDFEEILQVAESLGPHSHYRRVPVRRRNGINNSCEWSVGDDRVLILTNTGSMKSFLPAYNLDLIRPGKRDDIVTTINLQDTEFMETNKKLRAIKSLRHVTTAARSALDSISAGCLASPVTIKNATPAMLRSIEDSLQMSDAFNMKHRTPWQPAIDILHEDPSVAYDPPGDGIAIVSMQREPLRHSLVLRSFEMRVSHPCVVGPIDRMAAAQHLQTLAPYGLPS